MTYFKLYRKYAQILTAKEFECSKSFNPSGYFLICYKFSNTLFSTQGFKSIYSSRLLCYRFYLLVYIEKNCKAVWITELALGLWLLLDRCPIRISAGTTTILPDFSCFFRSLRTNSCITNYIATIFFCIHILFIAYPAAIRCCDMNCWGIAPSKTTNT